MDAREDGMKNQSWSLWTVRDTLIVGTRQEGSPEWGGLEEGLGVTVFYRKRTDPCPMCFFLHLQSCLCVTDANDPPNGPAKKNFKSANDSFCRHSKSPNLIIRHRGAQIIEGLGIMGDKMKFNVDKCGIICLGRNNQKEEQMLNELFCITLTRE